MVKQKNPRIALCHLFQHGSDPEPPRDRLRMPVWIRPKLAEPFFTGCLFLVMIPPSPGSQRVEAQPHGNSAQPSAGILQRNRSAAPQSQEGFNRQIFSIARITGQPVQNSINARIVPEKTSFKFIPRNHLIFHHYHLPHDPCFHCSSHCTNTAHTPFVTDENLPPQRSR